MSTPETHAAHAHKEETCCATMHARPKAWTRDPMMWILVLSAALTAASFFVPLLAQFKTAILHYIHKLWLPALAGLFLGGLLERFVPESYISKQLSHKGKRTVFYSVGLGFLMSACSHGLLAVAMELHRKGASSASIVSFLLASPWASLPITFMLLGLFGAKAFLIIFCALVIAVITGLVFQVLERAGLIEKNRHTVTVHESFSIRRDVLNRLRAYRFSWAGLREDFYAVLRGAGALARMTLGWTVLGLVIASLSNAFVPTAWFHRFLGPSLPGLFGTMLFATVLEVCSEGTSPLAFEIYRQTGAFGNALVFLMGGVVTDYTEIGMIWQNIGRKTALWMLIITLPQVLLFGWLFNQFRFR